MTELVQSLRERFARLTDGPLRPLREAAFARFVERGLPTNKDEEWKYTSLAPLAQLRFDPAPEENSIDRLVVPDLLPDLGGVRLVFVDGRHQPRLSSPGPAFVGSMARRPDLLARDFAGSDSLTALNTAFLEDGAFIEVPPGVVLEQPIHLHFISRKLAQPRNLIVLGANSQASVIETWAGLGDDASLTNAVTEIVLGDDARLDHYKLQEEGAGAFHVALAQVRLGRGSRFHSHSFALGAALARSELRALFADEGSECALNGLYLANGKQHLDNRTVIDHRSPRCTSRELYKGVLDGQSRGVFSGKVLVRQDAQKTDASQTNKNLLLSDDALVDTKPQLEIFADDVKCAHGAAVGRLDEDALFYLRSRGLPREAARSLLTWAFASEMVNLVPLAPLRARVHQRVTSRLKEAA